MLYLVFICIIVILDIDTPKSFLASKNITQSLFDVSFFNKMSLKISISSRRNILMCLEKEENPKSELQKFIFLAILKFSHNKVKLSSLLSENAKF